MQECEAIASQNVVPIAKGGLAVVAGVVGVVLIAFCGRYGYHRDELYFIACGHHLAWGYPDQPSLVPLLARIMTAIDPTSLAVLRIPSDIAAAGTVWTACRIPDATAATRDHQ